MKLKFNLIISNTERSLFYARELKKNNLYPENIVYLDDRKNKYYFKNKKIF